MTKKTTAIQWTDKTWNPVTGCTKVSPGCDNCYASTLHNQRHGHTVEAAVPHRRDGEKIGATIARLRSEQEASLATGAMTELSLTMAPCYDTPFAVVQVHEDRLRQPLKWKQPAKIFTCSMGDLFHADVPFAFIDRVFAVMALTPQHTYQVLTKRPERMREYLTGHAAGGRHIWTAAQSMKMPRGQDKPSPPWPLPNVWLGTSVENQEAAEARIPHLLATPAAVRFLSCEPLVLGPLFLSPYFYERWIWHEGKFRDGVGDRPSNGYMGFPHVNWVIVGGESGAGARPMDLAWVRDIVRQCQAAGVAVFVKQLGAKPFEYTSPGSEGGDDQNLPLKLKDRHGGDMDEWPADLRIREWPGAEARSEFQVPSSGGAG